jgi:hypothetical protein
MLWREAKRENLIIFLLASSYQATAQPGEWVLEKPFFIPTHPLIGEFALRSISKLAAVVMVIQY